MNKIDDIIEQRGKEYGDFRDNCKFAYDFFQKNVYKLFYCCGGSVKPPDFKDTKVLHYYIFMIGAKLARLHFNPTHEDSINDLLGYTKIYKQSCKFRFNFFALEEHYDKKEKMLKHKEFIDLVNVELNKASDE